MRTGRVLAAILLCACLFRPLHSRAADGGDLSAAAAVWESFLSALAGGRHAEAYRHFSPASREVFPYRTFLAEYGPMSAARETVLAGSESQTARFRGDWAEIELAFRPRSSPVRVTVCLSRQDDGGWLLVAARNEERERIEADARTVLAKLSPLRTSPGAAAAVAGIVRQTPPASAPSLKFYDFGVGGGTIRAVPKTGGFRAFSLDGAGLVRTGSGPARPAATTSSPPPPPEPPLPGPSVRPPEPARGNGQPPEIAEPPGLPLAPPGPETALPDRIGF